MLKYPVQIKALTLKEEIEYQYEVRLYVSLNQLDDFITAGNHILRTVT